MRIGNHDFDFQWKSYIMGILNITPDSFSDGGRFCKLDAALKQAEQMIREGASIIDVGGESTRPGHEKISAREEIERVVPVIEAMKKHMDIPISLDTYKYEVADAGLRAGADLINDIWGLRWDEGQMAKLIADTGVFCCLMHNRATADYSGHPDFLSGFCEDVEEILRIAGAAGIHEDRIILDPGVGFGKTYEHNLMIMKHLSVMKRWKLPVLLGASRKSMIGNALGLPVTEREEGTLVTTVMGRMAGASVFRVHDVKTNLRALRMTDAVLDIG